MEATFEHEEFPEFLIWVEEWRVGQRRTERRNAVFARDAKAGRERSERRRGCEKRRVCEKRRAEKRIHTDTFASRPQTSLG